MTTRSLIRVSFVLALMAFIAFTFTNCTDDEQQKMIQQQKQQAPEAQPTPAPTPTETPTPEAAAETQPTQPTTRTVYHFTSNSEKATVNCTKDGSLDACGARFENCGPDENHSYYCQTGVHEWVTQDPVGD
jgi:hypothetical protein